MAEGYLGMFRVPEGGAIIPIIRADGSADIAVEERVEVQGESRISKAVITLSGVEVITGAVRSVTIEARRRNPADTDWEAWEIIGTFDVDWSGSGNGQVFIIPGIASKPSGIEHEFKATFANGDGEQAILGDQGTLSTDGAAGSIIDTTKSWVVDQFDTAPDTYVVTEIGTFAIDSNSATALAITEDASALLEGAEYQIRGGVLTLTEDESSTFNGISDLDELIGVRTVSVTNLVGADGIPSNAVAHLAWADMKLETPASDFHDFAGNTTESLSEAQIASISGYSVYMFVSTAGLEPVTDYPTTSDANGVWYLAGETTGLEIDIPCPRSKRIAFAVGAKTQASLSAGGSSAVKGLGRMPGGIL